MENGKPTNQSSTGSGLGEYLNNIKFAKPDRFLQKSPDRFLYQNALIIDSTGKAYFLIIEERWWIWTNIIFL